MYVCICNALTDTQIQSAIASGAGRTHDVYAACNCRAQCGSCTASILCMLRSRPAQAEGEAAMAAVAN
ncbi:(2Fe-2S)-binding protein [Roseomonas sp. SSH11]|uniref:Bacterioferritin-associated ferredoxin n=1 Tax=Pararoseomonas baculiformis TaxID=2820812 RepID=A0ABS4AAC5_9PROT|nr:(2Fe-2S)-binding protein [Pararoseomonas baculiformis]MBP0443957.1 (2Fe-2S)-binding protein [Pararoseomonas baculiformis]